VQVFDSYRQALMDEGTQVDDWFFGYDLQNMAVPPSDYRLKLQAIMSLEAKDAKPKAGKSSILKQLLSIKEDKATKVTSISHQYQKAT